MSLCEGYVFTSCKYRHVNHF